MFVGERRRLRDRSSRCSLERIPRESHVPHQPGSAKSPVAALPQKSLTRFLVGKGGRGGRLNKINENRSSSSSRGGRRAAGETDRLFVRACVGGRVETFTFRLVSSTFRRKRTDKTMIYRGSSRTTGRRKRHERRVGKKIVGIAAQSSH